MAKSSAAPRTVVRSWEDAVARIRTELPLGIDIHLRARSSLRRDKQGMHATESFELTCYDDKLAGDDERAYQIVATSPRELYARYVSEFLPAVKRAFASVSPSEFTALPGQRTFRLGHNGVPKE